MAKPSALVSASLILAAFPSPDTAPAAASVVSANEAAWVSVAPIPQAASIAMPAKAIARNTVSISRPCRSSRGYIPRLERQGVRDQNGALSDRSALSAAAFLAGAFFESGFLTAAFLVAVFFVAAFFAAFFATFFAGAFFTAAFFTAAFFAGAFFAAAFLPKRPRAGLPVSSSSFTTSSNVSEAGSRSLGILPLSLPSLMYGPYRPLSTW